MPSVLVVDDRKEMRTKLVQIIEANIPDGSDWVAKGIYPLDALSDYAEEIHDNDVAAMILDENLHEQEDEAGKTVDYDGHEIAMQIRGQLPEFPIFIVPAVSVSDELDKTQRSVEDIIQRDAFLRTPEIYVERVIRAGSRFSSAQKEDLNALATLSSKAALGSLSSDERETMQGIREKLALSAPPGASIYSSEVLSEAELLVKDARELVARLQKK